MRRYTQVLFALLATLLLSVSLVGCGQTNETNEADESKIETLDDLHGKNIGVPDGSSFMGEIERQYPDSELFYFTTYSDLITALESGRIDAYISDGPVAKYQLVETDSIRMLDEHLTTDNYAFVLNPENTELKQKIDETFFDLEEEGIIDELIDKWIEPMGTHQMDVNTDLEGPNGVLRVITCAIQQPFSYVQDNKVIGYDIELIYLIADRLGYSVELTNTNFMALFASLLTDKADVALGCITVTEERSRSVLFTTPVYSSGAVAIVPAESQTHTDFFTGIVENFKRTFIDENRWQMVLSGLLVTIILSIATVIFGTLGGFLFSFPLRSKGHIIGGISRIISALLNGMPLVVILMLFYYVVFSRSSLSAVAVGIIAFSLEFANTVANLLNTGVKAVDKGQLEAASSMGYKKWQIFTKITLPQAAEQMFSQYMGAIVSMIKGTAIVGYVAVEDLTKVSDIIRSRTYEAFFPLILTALIYFAFARLAVFLLQQLGKFLDPKHRKRVVKGVQTND